MAEILFLEDEVTIREVIAEYMNVAGHKVTECGSGDEAVERLKEKSFDLAVLDINVVGMSGLKVLEYIRNELKSDMGVIMLTAYEDINTQVEAFNFFADDYITKPASPIILLKRIDVLLRRIKSESSMKETSLVIDDKAFRAYFEGKDLSLTVSEFLLLKTLHDLPNQVLSREQLILSIFNEDYIGNDRIIDAHIKNLRKKLPVNVIDTVIGVGYRWKED
ncbi:MAG: response regulator transcription factor [Lachnospiraceae bacterium]|nr:response regulator transcription factor [Lachnospiraceae bacterium]